MNQIIINQEKWEELDPKIVKQIDTLFSQLRGAPTKFKNIVKEPYGNFKLIIILDAGAVVGIARVGKMNAKLYDEISHSYTFNTKLPRPAYYVCSVIVNSKYRGRGYGKKLLDTVDTLYKKDKVLETSLDNYTAIALYLKQGYRIVNIDTKDRKGYLFIKP